MRLLGLDYGKARIGVAVSDTTGTLATPHSVIRTKNHGDQVRAVQALVEELEVEGLVVGIPFQLDGEAGEMAQIAEKFALKLEKVTGLPVHRWDERFTSVEAEEILRDIRPRRPKKKAGQRWRDTKGEVDRIAAALILQGFLDGHG